MILSTRPSTAVTCPTSICPEVSTLPKTLSLMSMVTRPVAAMAFAM